MQNAEMQNSAQILLAKCTKMPYTEDATQEKGTAFHDTMLLTISWYHKSALCVNALEWKEVHFIELLASIHKSVLKTWQKCHNGAGGHRVEQRERSQMEKRRMSDFIDGGAHCPLFRLQFG